MIIMCCKLVSCVLCKKGETFVVRGLSRWWVVGNEMGANTFLRQKSEFSEGYPVREKNRRFCGLRF